MKQKLLGYGYFAWLVIQLWWWLIFFLVGLLFLSDFINIVELWRFDAPSLGADIVYRTFPFAYLGAVIYLYLTNWYKLFTKIKETYFVKVKK